MGSFLCRNSGEMKHYGLKLCELHPDVMGNMMKDRLRMCDKFYIFKGAGYSSNGC